MVSPLQAATVPMHCPACIATVLIPQALEPGLPVSACMDCHGALLSLPGYRLWRKAHADEAEAAGDVQLARDSARSLVCPKCARLMLKFRFSPDDRRLDLCPHCEEVWLDGGEWDKLKASRLHLRLIELFSPQWQESLRSGALALAQAELWRRRLGEDYERAVEIREWLADHPNATWIRMFLVHQEG